MLKLSRGMLGDRSPMRPVGASHIFFPIARAIGQLDDPTFRGVVLRSMAWSLACLATLDIAAVRIMHHLLGFQGWATWAGDFVGWVGASLLAFWLFLPVAAGIGTLYLDRIASAVERRFYPWLPPPDSATVLEQTWDGIVVALKVLALNVAGLMLALIIPGLGLILGWIVAAYAIGRGLFVAVAMRRMQRGAAEALYRQCRGTILVQGGLLALSAYIPILNLLLPVIATAAMVHILDMTLIRRSQQDAC